MTDYVLTGLVRRRAELTGEVEALHTKLKGLLTDLESLDATILQFDPSHRVEAIRPRAVRAAGGLGQPWSDEPDRLEHPSASCRADD